jgi:hypothetical protein
VRRSIPTREGQWRPPTHLPVDSLRSALAASSG